MPIRIRLEFLAFECSEILNHGVCGKRVPEIRAVRRGQQDVATRRNKALQLFEEVHGVSHVLDDLASNH